MPFDGSCDTLTTVRKNDGKGARGMKRAWNRWMLSLLVLAAAIASLIYGVCNGETGAVLKKATAICMECIGIG